MASKLKLSLNIMLLILLSTPFGQAANTQGNNTVNCENFIHEAMDKDPQFKSALQTYLKAKYSKLSVQAISAWTLGASVGVVRNEATQESDFQPSTVDALTYSFSIQKLFLTTGTRFNLSHNNSLSDMSYPASEPQPVIAFPDGSVLNPNTFVAVPKPGSTSQPDIKLSLVQPLLKNAFGLAERYPVIQVELQRQSALLDAQEAWENQIETLYYAYLDWLAAYENVQALQDILTKTKRLEAVVVKKVNAGVAERTELLRTRDTVLRYESQLAQANSRFRNATINIAFLRSGQAIPLDQIKSVTPEQQSSLPVCPLSQKEIQAQSVETLRLYKKLGLLKKQLEKSLEVARNDQLPSLDLLGEYKLKGYAEDKSGGYDTISNDKDYTVMLQASYPLGNPKAAGDQKRAQAGLEELVQSMIRSKQQLTLNKAVLVENIAQQETVFKLHQRQFENAQEKLSLDNKNYRIGRLDTFYLIDAGNALTNARLQMVNSEIQLKRLKIQYLALADQLLPLFPKVMQAVNEAQVAR